MPTRFALLLPEPSLEVLPPSATAKDVGLEEGHYYGGTVAPGVQLYWKQSPGLAWLANPLASALSGAHICGEAIVALSAPALLTDQEVQAALSALLAKASPRCQLPPALQPGRSGEAAAGLEQGPATRGRSQSSAALLLEQTPPPPAAQPGSSAAAPPTVAQQPPSPSPSRLALSAGAGEGSDPRQQLLWAIASRATSISWAPSTPRRPAGDEQAPAGAAATLVAEAAVGCPATAEGSDSSSSKSVTSGSSASSLEALGGEPEIRQQASSYAGSCCGSEEGHARGVGPWGYVRPEILALVVEQAGYSSAFALRLSQVCAGWRQAVREERSMLRLLRFRRLALLPEARCVRSGGKRAADRGQLPWLVIEAARAGSVTAALVAARHLEALSPPPSQTAWLWAKAAKKGHPEAQAKLGLAYYKGSLGLACDCEEAVLWLGRAAKQLAEHLEPSPSHPATGHVAAGAEQASGSGAIGGGGGVPAQAAPAPPLMSPSQCRACLAQAAHILGLLSLDGEGCKMDLGTAMRWLKVAEQHGCMEAGLILGSLYNTGQYG